jgi:hypothetical protein
MSSGVWLPGRGFWRESGFAIVEMASARSLGNSVSLLKALGILFLQAE